MGGRLEGRRVLVVGGGRPVQEDPDMPPGTGFAISVQLGREGATVAVGDRDADAAAAVEDGVPVIADVSTADGCAAMVDGAAAALGGLDGLVLNVGTGAGFGLANTTTDD